MKREAVDATQKAIAVMTAFFDGPEGNDELAVSVALGYLAEPGGPGELLRGFMNLASLHVNRICLYRGETPQEVLRKTPQVLTEMDAGPSA